MKKGSVAVALAFLVASSDAWALDSDPAAVLSGAWIAEHPVELRIDAPPNIQAVDIVTRRGFWDRWDQSLGGRWLEGARLGLELDVLWPTDLQVEEPGEVTVDGVELAYPYFLDSLNKCRCLPTMGAAGM